MIEPFCSLVGYSFLCHECLDPLTPNDIYWGRTAPLTSKRCILYIMYLYYIVLLLFILYYIFIQQIEVMNILNMVYTLCFFLVKMQFVSQF